MKQLITYFIKYPITGNVLLALLLIFGYFGLLSLRRTFFPENESKLIVVEAVLPGSSPQQIEKTVVLPIEESVDGLSGIDRVTSKSVENVGQVSIEVDKDYDTKVIVQDVKNAIDRINSFPVEMEPPSVSIKENLSFAISFALSGDVDLKVLKTFAQQIESDLGGMDEISKIDISGYPDEEIEIAFREHDLRANNLSIEQMNVILRKENVDLTGGTIKAPRENMLIRGDNKKYTADEIKEIIIKVDDGQIIRLKDVAEVGDRWADVTNRKFYDGKNGVVMTVSNTIHEDISDIVEAVLAYLEDFNKRNDSVQADVIRDGSIVLNERIELLANNGIIGFFLVLIFLSMFLHPRLASWVAIGIPVSFGGMFIAAAFYGLSLNVISLFGMIIVIGILVDDGIVISENIFQHYERGKTPIQAAVDGTMEVLPAVFSAIMTTVVAFSLFFMLDGRMGEFFPEMGFVVIATLIFSLVEGAFILPAHVAHSKALKRDKEKKPNFVDKMLKGFTKGLEWVRRKTYEPLLDFALSAPWLVVLGTVGLMIVTVTGVRTGAIKMTAFPFIENDFLAVNLKLQPGTNEEVTTEWMNYIEDKVWEVNDSLSNARQGGDSIVIGVEKTIGPSSQVGALNIILIPGEERNVRSPELTRAIQDAIGEIPNAESLSYTTPSPFGKAIAIALYSNDQEELEAAKLELMKGMDRLGKMKSITASDQKGLQEVNLSLNPKAYALNLTMTDVMGEVRKGFYGIESQRLQIDINEVKVWMRYDEEDRSSVGKLEQMRIRIQGKNYMLKDLVDITVERGLVAVEHIDRKRSVQIQADLLSPEVDGTNSVMAMIENTLMPEVIKAYPSVGYSVEGQIREQMKTGRSAQIAGPIVLILMMSIIILTFRSFGQAIAVFAIIPFAFIGVGWGHWFHGMQVSMFSYFGVIALIGVMVNDALVLVTAMNGRLKDGMSYKDALRSAGVSRFRPIILTSVTTIAGLAPLILETSFQAQFLIPMAIAIAYGLAIATLLTLVLLPSLLLVQNRIRIRVKWLVTGKVPNSEEIEPAVKELKNENLEIK